MKKTSFDYQFHQMCFRVVVRFDRVFHVRRVRRIDGNVFDSVRFDDSNGVVDENVVVRPSNGLIHSRSAEDETDESREERLLHSSQISKPISVRYGNPRSQVSRHRFPLRLSPSPAATGFGAASRTGKKV